MKKILSIILIFWSFQSFAQDLNARVQILSPQVQNTNKRPLDVLKTTIQDFLNNRKWCDASLQAQERIDCNFVITIKDWDGSSNFKAEAQIISSRPVYGSTYNTPVLSVNDKNFDFNYSEGQPLDFSDQSFSSNLSSLLAYYAYVIVGMDFDTFSKLGGTPYYAKAQAVLNNAQNAPYTGWKAFEGLKNRYWLIENLTNKSFLPLRSLLYTYHREGLDLMSEDVKKGRRNIAAALPDLTELDQQKQGSMLNQVFFSAKADEIINIFSASDPIEKTKIYNVMSQVDPANQTKYEALKNGK